jgi:hypothetical protein
MELLLTSYTRHNWTYVTLQFYSIHMISLWFAKNAQKSTLLYVTDCRSNPRTDQVSTPIHSFTIPTRRVARNDGEK